MTERILGYQEGKRGLKQRGNQSSATSSEVVKGLENCGLSTYIRNLRETKMNSGMS